MTRLSNSLFLTENELLDDENYSPGLLYHGNILLKVASTVEGILSLWRKHPVFTPPPPPQSEDTTNSEVSFAEYLRTWWYPVWKDILWDRELSIEAYILGKRITWEHPIGDCGTADILAEIDDIISVFTWSEAHGDVISESVLEDIHHIILRHIFHYLAGNPTRASIRLKSGYSVDVIFFQKHEQDIRAYITKQPIDISVDFYKNILRIFRDIFGIELAIERWEYRTF